MKRFLICVILATLIALAASQSCSDQGLLNFLGVQESCSNSNPKTIITCDSNNRLIGISIPQNFTFANTRADQIRLFCASRLQTFEIPFPTFNTLTRNFNNDLPSTLTVFRVNYQSCSDFDSLNNRVNTPPYLITIEISFNSQPLNFNDVTRFRYSTLKTLIFKGSINCFNYNPGDNFKCFPDSLVPNLNYLDLSNNGLVSVPSNIFALTQLTTLILANNRIVGTLALFPSLINLQNLDISNNSFNGLIPNMPNLVNFNYQMNNFDRITFTGSVRVSGVTVGNSGSITTNTPQIGALNVDTTTGYSAQFSLTGQPFTGLNTGGLKLLIANYSGQSTVILAQNANFDTDFALYGSSTSAPASMMLAGGATFYGKLIVRPSCVDQGLANAQQLIFGTTAQDPFINNGCRISHTVLYPAKDTFGMVGTLDQKFYQMHAIQFFGCQMGQLSDIRVKENIEPYTNVLGKVKQLNAYTYTLKKSFTKRDVNKRTLGLISQQVAKVFPEVVHEVKDHLYLEYPKLTAVLVEAAKELADQQDILEETNKQLSIKVEAQEQKIEQLNALVNQLSANLGKLYATVAKQQKIIEMLANNHEDN